MSSLKLRISSANHAVKEIAISNKLVLAAEAGANYALIDAETNEIVSDDLILKKQDNSLIIEINNEAIVELEQFYVEQQVAFDVGIITAEGSTLVTSATPVAEESHIVWQASDSDTEAGGMSSSDWMYLGGGLIGLAAIGTGIGVAVSNDNKETASNSVTGSIVGGPVIDTNDLSVIIYQADGVTVLGEGSVTAKGQFTITVGSYTGVVIAKVVNQGAAARL